MLLFAQGLCLCCALHLQPPPSSWGVFDPLATGIRLCGLDNGHARTSSCANSRTQLSHVDMLITSTKNAPESAHLEWAPPTQSQPHPLPTQSGFPQWVRLFSFPTGALGKKMKTSAMNKKSMFRVHTAKNSSLGSLIDYVHASDKLTKPQPGATRRTALLFYLQMKKLKLSPPIHPSSPFLSHWLGHKNDELMAISQENDDHSCNLLSAAHMPGTGLNV